jgi:hypothetical protein
MSLRAGLNAVAKGKIPSLPLPGIETPVVQPIAIA